MFASPAPAGVLRGWCKGGASCDWNLEKSLASARANGRFSFAGVWETCGRDRHTYSSGGCLCPSGRIPMPGKQAMEFVQRQDRVASRQRRYLAASSPYCCKFRADIFYSVLMSVLRPLLQPLGSCIYKGSIGFSPISQCESIELPVGVD